MTPTHQLKTAEQVASYYDHNTRRFLRLGGSGASAAIHRQIWAPGVETVDQAFLYLNQLVASAIQQCLHIHTPQRLLDLGCGVGGTATWLADQLGVSIVGVTNSHVQQAHASERARRLGLAERCRFVLADFMDLPDLSLFNAAYAIESFIHASQAARFFGQANRQLITGGRLVICDDFLADSETPQDERARPWLERFQADWQVNTLVTMSTGVTLAKEVGFRLVQATDLSAYLRSFHPLVLRAVNWLVRLPMRAAYWQNLSGGSALQVCVSHGWTKYLALVFEKEAECTPSQ